MTSTSARADRLEPVARPHDRFSFGLWTVGWRAADPFGEPTRPMLDPVESLHRLAELGAYGVSFHDDDLIPFGSADAEGGRLVGRFRAALDETGPTPPMPPKTLSTHPMFKEAASTAN